VLTSAGKRMAERLSTAFGILDSSLNSAIGIERKVVSIAACSSFGPYWLIPRLADFKDAHPDTEIELRLYSKDPELTQATADCIVTAQPVKAGYASIDLFEESAIAVAPPGLVRNGRIDDVPLITTDTADAELGDDWRFVAAAADVLLPKSPEWVRCTHYVLALEAAKSGLGVAIIPDFVAADAIGEGRLVNLGLGEHRLENRTYRICFKEARRREAALQKVLAWIKRSSRGDDSPDAPAPERKRTSE
jgi:DNA-binding transcriptional LysR family regulator